MQALTAELRLSPELCHSPRQGIKAALKHSTQNNTRYSAALTRRRVLGASKTVPLRLKPCNGIRRPGLLLTSADSGETLQLATAKLPKDVDVATFQSKLYQWANALTTNSTNLPLALPLRIDSVNKGFQMSMLRIRDDNRPTSVANITVTVEKEDAGNILFVRLREGEGSDMVLPKRGTSGGTSYLKALAASLVDVSKIVNSMPPAIKLAVVQSRK